MFFKKILNVVSQKGDKEPRRAYRVEIPGLRAKLSGRPVSFAVRDLSATGIGLVMHKPLQVGSKVEVNLFRDSELLIKAMHVKVVRIGKGFVGCIFEGLDRAQTDTLHEVVLVEQKKLADIKKKTKEKKESPAVKKTGK